MDVSLIRMAAGAGLCKMMRRLFAPKGQYQARIKEKTILDFMRVGAGQGRTFGEGRMRILASVAALAMSLGAGSRSLAAPDSVYQCMPSGFTIGIPPFYTRHDWSTEFDSRVLNLRDLQDQLADVFAQSGLFSNVAVQLDGPHPDSTDMTFLVSIPILQEVTSRTEPAFEISVSSMLVENLGGRTIFQQVYTEQFRPKYSERVASRIGLKSEVYRIFPRIAIRILRDLDAVLNQSSDAFVANLRASYTVAHASREPLWILPTLIPESIGGLDNYGRLLDESIRERLMRKDCFEIAEPPPSTVECLRNALQGHSVDESLAVLRACVGDSSRRGALLINWLSPVADSMKIRSVVLTMPEVKVLYDRSSTTVAGWRLVNTLEQHAAGIAQASHIIPH